jgi:cysteinyl-tRNA synthetase
MFCHGKVEDFKRSINILNINRNFSSRTFGSHLDIHSGGLDLAFPHHANEILQSTAYHQIQTWAKYWLHAGNSNNQKEKPTPK